MVICALLGVAIERLGYRPAATGVRGSTCSSPRSAFRFFSNTPASSSSAPNRRRFPDLIKDAKLGGSRRLAVPNTQVLVLFITLALLLALRFIVLNTKIGMAMRALSFNPTAAALMGVNTNVVISFTFGLGSALAAAAGILYALLYQSIEPFMGVLPGIKAFVAAVLGGIGNIPGAALGGVIIGVVETLVVGYSSAIGIPPGYRDGVAFAILILILLFKPSGLLGKVEREKV